MDACLMGSALAEGVQTVFGFVCFFVGEEGVHANALPI
jgi:hypothetical protein